MAQREKLVLTRGSNPNRRKALAVDAYRVIATLECPLRVISGHHSGGGVRPLSAIDGPRLLNLKAFVVKPRKYHKGFPVSFVGYFN